MEVSICLGPEDRLRDTRENDITKRDRARTHYIHGFVISHHKSYAEPNAPIQNHNVRKPKLRKGDHQTPTPSATSPKKDQSQELRAGGVSTHHASPAHCCLSNPPHAISCPKTKGAIGRSAINQATRYESMMSSSPFQTPLATHKPQLTISA